MNAFDAVDLQGATSATHCAAWVGIEIRDGAIKRLRPAG